MFTVKWFAHGKETAPIEVEAFSVNGPEVVMQACQFRLTEMRLKHTLEPPNGFLVFDGDNHEIGRWFLIGRSSTT
jgi:hypothetical protein